MTLEISWPLGASFTLVIELSGRENCSVVIPKIDYGRVLFCFLPLADNEAALLYHLFLLPFMQSIGGLKVNSNLEAPYLKHLIQPFINLSVFYTGKKVHIFLVDFSLKTLWRTNLEVNSASTTFLAVWSGERQEYHCLTSFCYKAVTKRSNTEGCCKD